jgi:hypothetical protein
MTDVEIKLHRDGLFTFIWHDPEMGRQVLQMRRTFPGDDSPLKSRARAMEQSLHRALSASE